MSAAQKKIVKPAGQSADAFEEHVAQELVNLEVCAQGPHAKPFR